MCLGGGDSAAKQANKQAKQTNKEMKADEKRRQQDILQGQGYINDAFDPFNEDYFNQYATDWSDYYLPQIDTQYGDAKAKLTAALAGKGLLDGTVGIDKLADLSNAYETEKTNTANAGVDAANALRQNIEKSKSNLFALNEASADPSAINTQAMGQATSLAAPQAFTPIGQVFSAFLDPFVNFAGAKQNSPGTPYASPIKTAPTGQGTQKVVG